MKDERGMHVQLNSRNEGWTWNEGWTCLHSSFIHPQNTNWTRGIFWIL